MKWLKARLSSAKEWIAEKWKAALIVIWITLVSLVLWKVPERQVRYLRQSDISRLEPKDRIQFEKDVITAENSARLTLAQILGGFALLVGLYFTYKNIRVTEEGKLTERFSKAVELLGSEKLDVRLGGIYALERIARDSLKDHWTVTEVLTAFVREQSKKENEERKAEGNPNEPESDFPPDIPPMPKYIEYEDAEIRLREDIQAALTVIGRRKWTDKEKPHQQINLSYSIIDGANLEGANLDRADLYSARLNCANFDNALLNGANLSLSQLICARFNKAQLTGSIMGATDLSRARLKHANLDHSRLDGATFDHATLVGANLKNARCGVNTFRGADLSQANLKNADLSHARDISWKQVSKAIIDDTTKLPPELEKRRRAEQESKVTLSNKTPAADIHED